MKRRCFTRIELLIVISILAVMLGILTPAVLRIRGVAPRMICGENLAGLGKALIMYSVDNDDKFPTPSKWCDLLIEHTDITAKQFRCYGNKQQRCGYAMNPNCEPNSPPDTVLLFDATGWKWPFMDWNQFGGFELMTFANHKGDGCNILFNDSHVRFISLRDVCELNWGDEQKQ